MWKGDSAGESLTLTYIVPILTCKGIHMGCLLRCDDTLMTLIDLVLIFGAVRDRQKTWDYIEG